MHKPGQFGCKASAALRSLYPIVRGLGGRCLCLITTVVGAAAGGNLLLLTFDMSRDRQLVISRH